ncbi:MAG: DinB family protein [Gemmatimonadetes bacterium]|nr:DinB family protein [Gemmatimonadota bacterium]
MASVTDLVFGDIAGELDNTRRLLETVTDEHFDWTPHEKSWHLGGLAKHISDIPLWCQTILATDELDLAALPPQPDPPTSIGSVLENFDSTRAALETAIADATPDTLVETWTLRRGDHEITSGPKAVIFRQLGVSHLAHHRGQLTVYLRLLDIAVPQTYGPTADDQGGFG